MLKRDKELEKILIDIHKKLMFKLFSYDEPCDMEIIVSQELVYKYKKLNIKYFTLFNPNFGDGLFYCVINPIHSFHKTYYDFPVQYSVYKSNKYVTSTIEKECDYYFKTHFDMFIADRKKQYSTIISRNLKLNFLVDKN